MGGWMGDYAQVCFIVKIFYLVHMKGGRLYELYHAFIAMSIGIIELFQLVSF